MKSISKSENILIKISEFIALSSICEMSRNWRFIDNKIFDIEPIITEHLIKCVLDNKINPSYSSLNHYKREICAHLLRLSRWKINPSNKYARFEDYFSSFFIKPFTDKSKYSKSYIIDIDSLNKIVAIAIDFKEFEIDLPKLGLGLEHFYKEVSSYLSTGSLTNIIIYQLIDNLIIDYNSEFKLT